MIDRITYCEYEREVILVKKQANAHKLYINRIQGKNLPEGYKKNNEWEPSSKEKQECCKDSKESLYNHCLSTTHIEKLCQVRFGSIYGFALDRLFYNSLDEEINLIEKFHDMGFFNSSKVRDSILLLTSPIPEPDIGKKYRWLTKLLNY